MILLLKKNSPEVDIEKIKHGNHQHFYSNVAGKVQNRANIFNFNTTGLVIYLLILLLSITPLFAERTQDKRVIRVGVFQSDPTIFQDENGQTRGLYADLLNEIARIENWDIEYVPDTFAGGLQGLRTSDIDIMTSIVYSQERDTYADFSREIVLTVWGVVYVQRESGNEDVRALQGKKVAVLKNGIHGINFIKLCQEFDVSCDVIEMSSYDAALHALENGEADAAVTNSVFGTMHGAEHHIDQSSIVFSPTNAFFAFPEGKNRDIANIIDTHLNNWKQDENSIYNRSLAKWLMLNPKPVSVIPVWVFSVLGGLLIIALSFMVWTRLLRKIVSTRTSALEKSKKRYQSLYNNAPDMYISLAPDDTTIIECNNTLLQRTGYSRKEIIDSPIYKIYHKNCLDKVEEAFMQYHEFGEVHEIELSLRKKDGGILDVSLNMNAVKDDSGKILYSTSSWRDISESKKVKKSLKKSEERFRQISEYSQELIWEVDANGLYTYINDVSKELLGYEVDEIVGKMHYYDLFPFKYRDKFVNLALESISNELPFKDFTNPLQAKDGSILWFSTNGIPLIDKTGNLLGYRGADINITERKLAEDALIESERKMHTWLENSPVCTKIIDLDFNLQFMSKAGITVLKIEKIEDYYGKPYPFNFFPDSYKTSMIDKMKRAGKIGKVLSHEGSAEDLAGNSLWFYATIVPVYKDTGKLDYFIVVSQDITERKLGEKEIVEKSSELEIQFEKSEKQRVANLVVLNDLNQTTKKLKLEIEEREKAEDQIQKDLLEKNTLLQELYHRTKNNMQVISSMLHMKARRSPNELLQTSFKEITSKINTMALVHQKLYQTKDLSRINLSEYIHDLVHLVLRGFSREADKITFQYKMEDIYVLIDTVMPLGLVINELITNSLKHAFPDDMEGEIVIKLKLDSQDVINLTLADSGIGIPEDMDLRESKSMGLQTMFSLIEHQLQGSVEYQAVSGLSWDIQLKDTINSERV